MIKNITSVKIGPIWNSAHGAVFKEEIDSTPDLGEEITLQTPVMANLMLVRMKDGVMAVLSDFSCSAQLTCARCLDTYVQDIHVESFERLFYEHQPSKGYDPLETFLVSMKDMSIDLTESLRQEIILHFPMIPVCSERCQGLCSSCAVNLNHEKHKKGCTAETKVASLQVSGEENRPFANLKDLFNK